ncbi:uncharacterized protein LOC129592305 [Paramacrobiotus metropolitanus]|uniref:uncharacterized protein LOC129592305 n=1 Tax=Paramacrobiotus metropolitanus TaxID=2943436 RepID=UPI002445A248|nr:uncharacterized protein LOC129592305 [Paramacrobiotus metropolitanus]
MFLSFIICLAIHLTAARRATYTATTEKSSFRLANSDSTFRISDPDQLSGPATLKQGDVQLFPEWDAENHTLGSIQHRTCRIKSLCLLSCPSEDHPKIWVLEGSYQHMSVNEDDAVRCEVARSVRGCPFTLMTAHLCSGATESCSVHIKTPDEADDCGATHYSIGYQCLPAEHPLKPYAKAPKNRDDRCYQYYSRKYA